MSSCAIQLLGFFYPAARAVNIGRDCDKPSCPAAAARGRSRRKMSRFYCVVFQLKLGL